MKTRQKLALLATLYFSQGLPFGFFLQALPVMLRAQGVSLEAIGLSSLLALPWALKFAWAPWIDRAPSLRRVIVTLQLAATALLVCLAFVDGSSLAWLCAGVLLTNLLAATQDIATDGLAVQLLDESERGLGNGVQVAGYRVGMIVGGGLLLVIFADLGWTASFLLMGALLLLATLPIAFSAEALPPRAVAPKDASLTAFLRSPGAPRWLCLIALYKAGDAAAGGMLRPWLVDIGFELDELGWLLGTAGFSSGLAGALIGGLGTHSLGRRRALVVFGLAEAIALGLHAAAALAPEEHLRLAASAVCLVEHFTGGLATVALFTAMMDRCRVEHGATDYTLQASVVVAATGTAAALSGYSASHLGYPAHFTLSAVTALLGVAAMAKLGDRRTNAARQDN